MTLPLSDLTGLLNQVRAFEIHVAREALAEEQAHGFDKQPRITVDNKIGAPMESVLPFGRIEMQERAHINEIIDWIWKRLWEKSPVETGRYQESHIVFINGQQVHDITRVQPGDKVQIVNSQPYARKIERGESMMAPNGVYRSVYAAARRRFGRLVYLKYTFVPLNTGAVVRNSKGSSKHKFVPQVYPAIVITPTRDGTLL